MNWLSVVGVCCRLWLAVVVGAVFWRFGASAPGFFVLVVLPLLLRFPSSWWLGLAMVLGCWSLLLALVFWVPRPEAAEMEGVLTLVLAKMKTRCEVSHVYGMLTNSTNKCCNKF